MLAAGVLVAVSGGCGREERPPNVLWIVWDTVRADRLSLYGHDRSTTPNLEALAAAGRVYDATSASCWTIPSHTSMFTGLFPGEHGVHGAGSRLAETTPTLAELLAARGYSTFLFSANPFLVMDLGTSRGFETVEHPMLEGLAERSLELVEERLHPLDRRNELRAGLRSKRTAGWQRKAVGSLTNERFERFLDGRDESRPFFAFLNYMEAHRPRAPRREDLERFLDETEIRSWYRLDRSKARLHRLSLAIDDAEPLGPRQLDLFRTAYDATLVELDELLAAVFEGLERRGLRDSTVVVLTSDHGEHLGEHGSYLHQYSLFEPVVSVPLVVWAPGRIEPGREAVPVSNVDLFPTLLALTGVEGPQRPRLGNLLSPQPRHPVVSEYLVAYRAILAKKALEYPDWDPSPYERQLRSLRLGDSKLLWRSGGGNSLFDLADDPLEGVDLTPTDPTLASRLEGLLTHWISLGEDGEAGEVADELSDEQLEWLQDLGYL